MIVVLASIAVASAQDPAPPATTAEVPAETPAPAPATATDSGRLSFDDRVVKGQVAAGSVYLFQRNPRALPALVPVRRSYRSEIVDPLLGERPKPKATDR